MVVATQTRPGETALCREPDSLTALVVRATVRDREAFGQLYEVYKGRVHRHVYYMIGKRDEAEDLTAQTFLQAWQAIDRFRPGSAPFISWLLRIAHNLVVSRFRAHREYLPLEDGWGWGAVDSHPQPDKLCEVKDDGQRLRRAMLKLKAQHRQVIELRFGDDLDYPQVAAIMGRSIPAVRVIQHRALATLKRLMEEEDDCQCSPRSRPSYKALPTSSNCSEQSAPIKATAKRVPVSA